jgi:MFS superfamily sulfate permease-like transporter
MLEFREGARYYKTSKVDFGVWLLTFVVCLLGGAMYGIYAGVGLALLMVLWQSAAAKTVLLGRLPGTSVYRDVRRFPMAKETDGVRVVRLDGSLNFCNWERTVERVHALTTKGVHSVVVDASAVTTIDSSSLRGLVTLVKVSVLLQ